MPSGAQTDVIVMDFSKAFDKVCYQKLAWKLHHYGIGAKTNRWIQSFLRDREQSVVVNGETSTPAAFESEVPQGSALGSSLFHFILTFYLKT